MLVLQARAMSIVTLGFSTGTVLGPALGGLLAEPCEQYGASFPLCTANGLFRVRYALPVKQLHIGCCWWQVIALQGSLAGFEVITMAH